MSDEEQSLSDSEIIRHVLAGNREAFSLLYMRYCNLICCQAYRYLGNRDDADEVTQDTFANALDNIETLKNTSAFFKWLRVICKHLCFQHQMKRQPALVGFPLNPPDTRIKVLSENIKEWLGRLPDDLKLIARLWLNGYSHAEIAEMLDISVSSSRHKWSKALNEFSKIVREPTAVDMDRILSIVITPDGRLAVSGSANHSIKIWDISTGICLRTLKKHTDEVRAVAVIGGTQQLLSGSTDTTIRLWNTNSDAPLRTLRIHEDRVRAVAVVPDTSLAISGSGDCTIKVWKLESGEVLRTLRGHTDWINALAVTRDGQTVISASDDHTLKVFNMNDGEEIHTLKGHKSLVLAVEVIGVTNQVISSSFDHTIKLWDIENGKELRTLKGHSAEVRAVSVDRAGRIAASASYDKRILVWDLHTYTVIDTFPGDCQFTTCAISSDGCFIVAGDILGYIHFLRLSSGPQGIHEYAKRCAWD